MATRTRVPAARDLYDEDFYVWAGRQAELLRARRFDELDLDNLVEEVEDLAGALTRSARSRIRRIVEHLLKLQHSPARDPRGAWYDTVIAQRSDLLDELTPAVRREVGAELPGLYDRARQDAGASLRKHGEAAAAALPETCPYTLDGITGDWLP